uniref:Uncharacterized protein n=1 Tax=Graphocephala atropunctata TaxID=36148 RepID=A0A1B6M9P4_9HEMI
MTFGPYCKMPDRRFYSELQRVLRPGDTEQLTNKDPPRSIPCVVDYVTGEILRIPTVDKEQWIADNCRKADVEAIGYRPELYENWFEEVPEDLGSHSYSAEEKEILDLILQAGRELDSSSNSSRRNTHMSLQSKLDMTSFRELRSMSSAVVSAEFESFLKRIIRELEENKNKLSGRLDSDEAKSQRTQEDEDNDELVKFLKEITAQSSLKVKVPSKDSLFTQNPSAKVQNKSLLKVYSSLSSLTATSADLYKSVSQQLEVSRTKKVLPADESQFMGSRVRYRVDYTDFDSSVLTKNTSADGHPLQ